MVEHGDFGRGRVRGLYDANGGESSAGTDIDDFHFVGFRIKLCAIFCRRRSLVPPRPKRKTIIVETEVTHGNRPMPRIDDFIVPGSDDGVQIVGFGLVGVERQALLDVEGLIQEEGADQSEQRKEENGEGVEDAFRPS